MERLKQELLACLGEEGLKLHEMMKEHTTFRVGGAADYFIQPKSAEELRAAFEILHRYEMPVLVIGNGSNLLVRDKGIRGAVIQIYNRMAEDYDRREYNSYQGRRTAECCCGKGCG